MTAIATVYAVFADAEEAERIGQEMIAKDLAACANILAPCRSVYRWEGAIETATEVPALFKTRADRVDALIAAIARLHSYAVPAITAWPIIQAGPGYAEWVSSGQALGLR
jgi:periplasmic divalent cation tolerance protein